MTRAMHGESNSLLILGGPGSCKSAIVASALNKLNEAHPEKSSFYTIQLDGLIQTDDKIALKEIARQLALEMNVDLEKVRTCKTNANVDVNGRYIDNFTIHIITSE